MREIKFRGKDIETNEWRYGSLIIERDGYYIFSGKLYFIDNISGNFSGVYEIIPETVGQYSGHKDKDGREIYEGDIIKDIMFNATGIVRFKDGCFNVKWIDWDEDEASLDIYIGATQEYIEIIGNIYENPELLKDEINND